MLEKIFNKLGYIKNSSELRLMEQKIIELRSNNRSQTDSLLMFMRERENYGEGMERLADLEDAFRQLQDKTIEKLAALNKKLKLRDRQRLSYRKLHRRYKKKFGDIDG